MATEVKKAPKKAARPAVPAKAAKSAAPKKPAVKSPAPSKAGKAAASASKRLGLTEEQRLQAHKWLDEIAAERRAAPVAV